MKKQIAKRIRMKRKSGEESPIPLLTQDYVKAIVAEAVGKISIEVINDQLRTTHIQIRAIIAILTDLQASANLAAVNSGSPRAILQELVENMQSSLNRNLELLKEIMATGATDIQPEQIEVVVAVPEPVTLNEEGIAAVMENLRAQAAHTRGAEGEEFDEEDDIIASAMENVDGLVDMGDEYDVRGTGGTRQPQRRRRPTS